MIESEDNSLVQFSNSGPSSSIDDYFLEKEEGEDIEFNLSIGEYDNEHRIPLSPTYPISKNGFVKMRISCKNIQMLINKELFEGTDKINTEDIQVKSFCQIILNGAALGNTKSILHNSPKFREEIEIDIHQKTDNKILIELYAECLYYKRQILHFKNKKSTYPQFLGFQLLPVDYFEKSRLTGIKTNLYLKFISTHHEEYFDDNPESITYIDNHNPNSYLIREANITSNKEAFIQISLFYLNKKSLGKINCSIFELIRREDIANKNQFLIYKLLIKRMDGLEWFKESTIEDIERFRNRMISYCKDLNDVPFPSKHILSYLPFIGKYYEEEDNKQLKDKIKMIDEFFEQVTSNPMLSSLAEFEDFFRESEYTL